MWTSVIHLANRARIDLSAQEQDDEQGGTAIDTGLLNDQGQRPGSAALRRVHVQRRLQRGRGGHPHRRGRRSSAPTSCYDMGKSINPATDVGQIEGAFMQGVGRVLLEDVVTQMTGPNQGQNNTPNTWGYKIPASTTVPAGASTSTCTRGPTRSQVPENPNLLMSAKEVGEPPLCMATTVYFA